MNVNERSSVKRCGQYPWSRQGADAVALTTGKPVKFNAADSHRARLDTPELEGDTGMLEAGFSLRPTCGRGWREAPGEGKAGFPVLSPLSSVLCSRCRPRKRGRGRQTIGGG